MIAQIKLWGRTVAAASLDETGVCKFEYEANFQQSGIEVSPIAMPLSGEIYRFPGLPRETFYGLPGLLADALPDKFGNALINAWLATQGRTADSFNAIERLCYSGKRGMGALEFEPATNPASKDPAESLEVGRLVELASEVLSHRERLQTKFGHDDVTALSDILRVGTSAGGARAKAVIAWNPVTQEVKSGQIDTGEHVGFSHWLLKFDGVKSNKDKELDDPRGYSAIEYAYSLMAKAAGIEMMPCDLLEENGRRHFLTKRFDRTDKGEKIHMQSLSGIAHFDFNRAGAYSYEQCFLIMRQLGLNMTEIEQQFRRMVFNIVARNQDDHVKNIAFLMDKRGNWKLSPAYDITFSYNPTGRWTSTHQMSMNGKVDSFTLDDFNQCGQTAFLKRGRAKVILQEVIEVVSEWEKCAESVLIDPEWIKEIRQYHRLKFA